MPLIMMGIITLAVISILVIVVFMSIKGVDNRREESFNQYKKGL